MSFIDFDTALKYNDFKYIPEYGWVTLDNVTASATESALLDEIKYLTEMNASLQRQIIDVAVRNNSPIF